MSDKVYNNSSIQAEYEDGFILDETELNDIYPEPVDVDGQMILKNVFYAILHKLPETEHGHMTRFSLFYKNRRYDIDWTILPDNARPVRFRHAEQDSIGAQITRFEWVGVDFGYQYNDETGANQEEIMNLN